MSGPGYPTEPCDLDAMEALTRAVTQGPWVVENDQGGGDGYDVYSWTDGFTEYVAADLGDSTVHSRGAIRHFDDAHFIAVARTAIPALIAELRAHRTALAQIEALAKSDTNTGTRKAHTSDRKVRHDE